MEEVETSAKFEWHDVEEVFHFLAASFDVRLAKKFIRDVPRELNEVRVADVSNLIGSPPKREGNSVMVSAAIRINWDRAVSSETDITVPIILCKVFDTYMPIDGWHRLAKAKAEGRETLPCVVLTDEESDKVAHLPNKKRSKWFGKRKR